MQILTALDPAQLASRLVGGGPREVPKLGQGDRGPRVIGPVLIRREPRRLLFPIFCPEAGAPQGDQNVGALHFDGQVRVGHFQLPRVPAHVHALLPGGEPCYLRRCPA